jgi:hypothetical protein
MRIEVYDEDLLGKDLLGYCNVPLDNALKTPGKWAVNEIFPLDSSKEDHIKYERIN